jgi:RNA polymerase sigma factor (sigma-70 family)
MFDDEPGYDAVTVDHDDPRSAGRGVGMDLPNPESEDIRETQAYLLSRLRHGNPSVSQATAWERYYAQHQSRIRSRFRRWSLQDADVDDVIQEVWCLLLIQFAHASPETPQDGIDLALAGAVARQRSRRPKRYGQQPSTEELLWQIPSPEEAPWEVAQHHEWQELVQAALDLLSQVGQTRSSIVICLRSIQEESVEETAVILGWTVQQVRDEHYRAKHFMRALIEQIARTPFQD